MGAGRDGNSCLPGFVCPAPRRRRRLCLELEMIFFTLMILAAVLGQLQGAEGAIEMSPRFGGVPELHPMVISTPPGFNVVHPGFDEYIVQDITLDSPTFTQPDPITLTDGLANCTNTTCDSVLYRVNFSPRLSPYLEGHLMLEGDGANETELTGGFTSDYYLFDGQRTHGQTVPDDAASSPSLLPPANTSVAEEEEEIRIGMGYPCSSGSMTVSATAYFIARSYSSQNVTATFTVASRHPSILLEPLKGAMSQSVQGTVCCGALRYYDIETINPYSQYFTLEISVQAPESNISPLKIMLRRAGCAHANNFDVAKIVTPGESAALLSEEHPSLGGKVYVSLESLNQDVSSAYNEDSYVLLVQLRAQTPEAATIVVTKDEETLGLGTAYWFVLASIMGVIVGSLPGFVAYTHFTSRTRARYEREVGEMSERKLSDKDFVKLLAPSSSRKKASTSPATSPSPAQPTVRFADSSPVEIREEDIDFTLIARARGSIDKSVTQRIEYSDAEVEVQSSQATTTSSLLSRQPTIKPSSHQEYIAWLTTPHDRIDLKHGATMVGRGVCGVASKRVSRHQALLIFDANLGRVMLRTVGKNPTAYRKSGTERWSILQRDENPIVMK